jgi:hypothetical protein
VHAHGAHGDEHPHRGQRPEEGAPVSLHAGHHGDQQEQCQLSGSADELRLHDSLAVPPGQVKDPRTEPADEDLRVRLQIGVRGHRHLPDFHDSAEGAHVETLQYYKSISSLDLCCTAEEKPEEKKSPEPKNFDTWLKEFKDKVLTE